MKLFRFIPVIFFPALICLSSPVVADDIGLTICKSVMADDKQSLSQALRIGGFKLRDIYADLRCNNMTLLQVAMSKNANVAGEYIVGQVSKRILKKSDDLSWAEANGHAASPIVTALKARIE